MAKGEFVFRSEEFCIPVTKAEPLEEIEFIVSDFIKKKLTFCLVEKEGMWEIWRLKLEGDNDKIIKDGAPDKPDVLYVKGDIVEDYIISM